MKYAMFNESGAFVHLLVKGMHDIPVDAVHVSTDQAVALLNEQDGVWKLINGEIIKTPLPEPVEPPPQVPQSVTPAQGLMALYVLKAITEDDILAAIDSIEDPVMRYQALIAFKKATVWERMSEALGVVAQLMALTEMDQDELFTLGSTYTNL